MSKITRSYKTGRTAEVLLRVTPEEKERIKADAEHAGLSVSEYIRARTLPASSTPPTVWTAANASTYGDFTANFAAGVEKRLSSIEEAVNKAQKALGPNDQKE